MLSMHRGQLVTPRKLAAAVGRAVKRYRAKNGLTGQQLGDLLGVSRQRIHQIEHGRGVGPGTIEKLVGIGIELKT